MNSELYLSPQIYWKWKRLLVSSVTIPIRKKSTIIFARLVLLALPLYNKRDECRPEDNGDNDKIGSNKHSVVNNLDWQRET